jgi:lipopolysaccharide transport system permease protein
MRSHFPLFVRLLADERTARGRGSVLGRFSAFLFPLVEAAGFTLLFVVILQLREVGGYLLFTYVGVLAWRVFARGAQLASTSLRRSAGLLHSFPVPVIVVAGAAIASALVDGLLGLPVLFALLIGTGALPELSPTLLLLPLGAYLQLSTMLGVGLLLAVAAAYHRDVALALTPALPVLMLAAPVLYPAAMVPEQWRPLIMLNPMGAAIEVYRAAMLGGGGIDRFTVLPAMVVATMLLAAGIRLAIRRNLMVREVL